jgi:AcrR family transcriptional regulator
MRRVADVLGVDAMSLYTYVPGKAELSDLMLDRVYAEQLAAISTDGGWRAALESRARADWALYERHPWVLRAAGPRPTLGPNELAVHEASLRAVEGVGLSGREMVAVVTLVAGYVSGVTRGIAEVTAEGETHGSEEQWWKERSAVLDRVYDADGSRSRPGSRSRACSTATRTRPTTWPTRSAPPSSSGSNGCSTASPSWWTSARRRADPLRKCARRCRFRGVPRVVGVDGAVRSGSRRRVTEADGMGKDFELEWEGALPARAWGAWLDGVFATEAVA